MEEHTKGRIYAGNGINRLYVTNFQKKIFCFMTKSFIYMAPVQQVETATIIIALIDFKYCL